ncbi:MAG: protein jag [Minisyncoccia bacterium]
MEITLVKNFLENLLKIAGFQDSNLEINEDYSEKIIKINIRTEDSGILIGKGGENLKAFEFVLNTVSKKLIKSFDWHIVLDVNSYRTVYEEKLREFARQAAHKVSLSKRPLELPPMPAKDRRIIHLEIALRSDVKTESIGEGEERHIIIKPVEENKI